MAENNCATSRDFFGKKYARNVADLGCIFLAGVLSVA